MTEIRPRIIHIVPHDGIGGVETAARIMATAAAAPAAACDFQLLLIAGRSLVSGPARILQSPFRYPLNPLAQIRAVRLCLQQRPDVLVCSLWRSVGVALAVRLFRPRTRLAFFLNLDRPAHAVDAVASWVAIRAADEVWADSRATLEARLRGRTKPSRVISFVTDRLSPNGANGALPQPRFVSWSRLNRQKGIDRALRFVAELSRRGLSPSFDIWGPDDGELVRLRALARHLGIGGLVRFPGPADRDALPAIASDAGFFLQLSRSEGMAMGVVEAMQLGLVPVVTAVGEMPFYVRDGVNGLIVDGEDPGEAADRMVRLLERPDEYAQMRARVLAHWRDAPLYAADVCRAAAALAATAKPS